ncbi:MAG: class I SAM-dependent methyltransferase [Myxococcales bacterium]|nr:class I SAM-dependent methyltransferase [Myxococcales bacterium]MCB9716228.1 class I SAM-dependent methyltransferase [Myxococcales bacterium]
MSLDPERYFVELAAAFVRGRLPELAIEPGDLQGTLARGRAQGLSLHKFKRSATLPRVRRVLGVLRGLGPHRLLDVGSGRGTFLWPLLDAFPQLEVTALDLDPIRVRDLRAVHDGGLSRLRALQGDASALPVADDEVEVVTALEVLEHLREPELAAQELLRVAARFVVVSVPSGPDDNPQHIQLFSPDRMRSMFLDAGAQRVQIEHVPGHMIAVIRGPKGSP